MKWAACLVVLLITGNAITDLQGLYELRPENGTDRWTTVGSKPWIRLETPYARAVDRVNAHYGGWRKFKATLNEQRRHIK